MIYKITYSKFQSLQGLILTKGALKVAHELEGISIPTRSDFNLIVADIVRWAKEHFNPYKV